MWKTSVSLNVEFVKMGNGKTSRFKAHGVHRGRVDRPDCQPTFVVVVAGTARPRERTRQIVKRWARRTGIPSRRAPMALFHRRRTSITPLSRGPQFTGRDSSVFLKCLCPTVAAIARTRYKRVCVVAADAAATQPLFLFVCRLP